MNMLIFLLLAVFVFNLTPAGEALPITFIYEGSGESQPMEYQADNSSTLVFQYLSDDLFWTEKRIESARLTTIVIRPLVGDEKSVPMDEKPTTRKRVRVTQSDISCLAQNIYHEARGEPIKGQLAVAHVTLNRVASPHYPDSICEVVYQKNIKACQFSWTCNKEHTKIRDSGTYEKILNLSQQILSGEYSDPTQGADHYHADYVKPKWGKSKYRTVQIGKHIFYNILPGPGRHDA